MTRTLTISKAKEGSVLRLHPWVFPKAILSQSDSLVTGELVSVYGEDKKLIGVGVYNEHSLYRVRLLAYAFEGFDSSSLEKIVSYRLNQAKRLRASLELPNETTNAYRLVNSEGDGLSGLTIDIFDKKAVVSSSAYWVEMHQSLLRPLIQTHLEVDEVLWMPQVKALSQDGYKEVQSFEMAGEAMALEAGIQYQVRFSSSQKTGLFLDQRENHERIGRIARGKRVLDLYTYTGGFALHAAKKGALKVTAVDSSKEAIAAATINAQLNGVDTIEFIEADARDYLEKAKDYDLIILDPPKLAPTQKDMERAKNYYRFLHREVFKAMQPGSLLLTCNCSAALNRELFTDLVTHQAKAVSKMVRVLGIYGPAACHPTLNAFKEGQYLTAVLLAVV